jgi:cell division protein FtsQ
VLDSIPVRTLADVTLDRLADLELVEHDLMRRRLRAWELDLRYRDQVIARILPQ